IETTTISSMRVKAGEKCRWSGDSPSPPTEGGEGRGEEGHFCSRPALTVTIRMPLSPLVPRGEREKIRGRGVNSTAVLPALLLARSSRGEGVAQRVSRGAPLLDARH